MAGSRKIIFLTNAAAGTSPQFSWVGGSMAFIAQATFGGGSAKLQFIGPDGSTAIDVTGSTLSANGMVKLDLPAGIYQAVAATGSAFYVIGVAINVFTSK